MFFTEHNGLRVLVCRCGDSLAGLPLAEVGNTDATVAATVALAAAPAFDAVLPEPTCANGQLGPRLHVPLG